jgi:hypothetical protein
MAKAKTVLGPRWSRIVTTPPEQHDALRPRSARTLEAKSGPVCGSDRTGRFGTHFGDRIEDRGQVHRHRTRTSPTPRPCIEGATWSIGFERAHVRPVVLRRFTGCQGLRGPRVASLGPSAPAPENEGRPSVSSDAGGLGE